MTCRESIISKTVLKSFQMAWLTTGGPCDRMSRLKSRIHRNLGKPNTVLDRKTKPQNYKMLKSIIQYTKCLSHIMWKPFATMTSMQVANYSYATTKHTHWTNCNISTQVIIGTYFPSNCKICFSTDAVKLFWVLPNHNEADWNYVVNVL